MSGEFDYIRWVRAQMPANPPQVALGPGDDCAVVRVGDRLQLVTTDMLMDGVDFIVGDISPERIGRKALAVNLSDIAAMAGVPTHAVVSVALPKGSRALAEGLYHGMAEIAAEFGVSIVGGDTNSWNGPLVISIALYGDVTEHGYVTRAGAKPGDWFFVTGPLGNSIAGHHLDFTPRVREALALNATVKLNAMIDISDGLTQDLSHILAASGCGANLTHIPLRDGATLDGALGDGEDFELLLAVSPGSAVNAIRIGECTERGLTLDGKAISARGWNHHI